ncbi:lipopolysaccharide N-acetylglucosaminyltransferase [Kosakonia cowanii]
MIRKVVLTVTPIYSIPPRGAAAVESWMYNVAQRMSYENKIVCIRNDGYEEYSEVSEKCSIHRIGFSRLYKRIFQKWTRLDPVPYSQRILNIKNKFATEDESVIVVHNNLKIFRQISKRAPSTNLVLHMHNAFEPKDITPNAKIIVPSNYLKEFYQAYLPHANIKIVPNGIDLTSYQESKSVITRAAVGISSKDTVIFYAGRIVPDKGILLLMQAFESLAQKRSDLKLVVIGDQYSDQKGEIATYQRQVREIADRLTGRCIMVGGVAPEKMHHYYHLADLVVIPSQFKEPFCMVAIEAMGAAKPVLVSTRGGMTEFVKADATGLHLSEPMTTQSVVNDIETALVHPHLKEIGHTGKEYVFKHYSWEAVTSQFERLIREWFDQ